MSLILPEGLPAIDLLRAEGIVLSSEPPTRKPLRIALLNLMPMKLTTETDFARLLSSSPFQIELGLMKLRSHQSRHVPEEHMRRFYRFFDEMRHEPWDGLIVTGAPVEQLPFEDVDYWPELSEVFTWAREQLRSTLYICWAAQAGLYFHYGVPKYPLPRKMFGVFPQKPLLPHEPIFRGFDDIFHMPHSRHTEIRREDIVSDKRLTLLAESPENGVSIVMARGRDFFVTGHMEYEPYTLDSEYRRDKDKRDDVDLPRHYYVDDNPAKGPLCLWRSHAHLFFNNWINYYVNA